MKAMKMIEIVKELLKYNRKIAEDKEDHLSEKGKSFYRGFIYALEKVLSRYNELVKED